MSGGLYQVFIYLAAARLHSEVIHDLNTVNYCT